MFYEDKFAGYLQKRNISENTLASYLNDLSRFKIFCKIKNIENPSHIVSGDIEEYYTFLRQHDVSLSSARRHRSSLNAFYSFLMSEGLATINPVRSAYIPKQKGSPSQEDVLTPGEIKNLLSLKLPGDEKGMRDKAIIELLYASGMKVSELITLRYDDYNYSAQTVSFEGKSIPLYKSAAESLELYLRDSRPFIALNNEDAMFVNLTGSALTRQGLWKIIKKATKDAGISKKITPRILRRSVAVHMLENGADREDVEKMLSLSSRNSVDTYIRLLKDEQSESSYMRFHPFADDKK